MTGRSLNLSATTALTAMAPVGLDAWNTAEDMTRASISVEPWLDNMRLDS